MWLDAATTTGSSLSKYLLHTLGGSGPVTPAPRWANEVLRQVPSQTNDPPPLTAGFPEKQLLCPSLYKRQADQLEFPRRGHAAGLRPRDGRRPTRLDGHILWRDKSFPTAPNETSIIHAVSFFLSTNHVGSFSRRPEPAASDCQPASISEGNIVSYASLVMRKMPATCPVFAHRRSSC